MPDRFRFAGLTFDPKRGLERAGTFIPLAPLEVRALRVLLRAGGNIVSKDDFIRQVWGHDIVSEASVSRAVYRLRKTLRRVGAEYALVTVYTGGFRMGVPVAHVDAERVPSAAARECLVTARELIGRRRLEDMISATLAARRATRLAPNLVEGWVLLAQILVLRTNRGQIDRPTGIRRARWALQRALAVSPEAPAARSLLGWIEAIVDGHHQAGLSRIDAGIAADATDWTSHMYRAWVLHAMGRQDEGLDAFALMTQVNPMTTFSLGQYGYALGCRGRTAEALELLDRSIRVMPTVDSLFSARSSVAAMTGDLDTALRDARQCAALSPDVPNQLYALAYAQAASGAAEEARRTLATMRGRLCRLAPSWEAVALVGLGEREGVRDALARAERERCSWLAFVRYDPRVRPVLEALGPSSSDCAARG